MISKICSACKIGKTVDQFYKNASAKDGLNRTCKACFKIYYTRSGYRQKYVDRNAANLAKLKDKIDKLKSMASCYCCGESDPCCLDFHHTDPTLKEQNISDMMYARYRWEAIELEIRKCICVCSNCHKKIHAGRISRPDKQV